MRSANATSRSPIIVAWAGWRSDILCYRHNLRKFRKFLMDKGHIVQHSLADIGIFQPQKGGEQQRAAEYCREENICPNRQSGDAQKGAI